jgi:hypothetical protein
MPELATTTYPIRDQILIQEAAVLRTITRLNGYQVDVNAVYEHHESLAIGVKEYPALRVVDQGDHFIRRHGGMYEAQISVAVWCYFKEYSRENAKHLLRQLGSDSQKALQADEFVTGLAFWTQWQDISTRINDAALPDQLAIAVGEIGYRTKLEDPYISWYF